MGRISTLFQTIKDLNKDRWVRKYNPHQRFFVDVDWYNTEEDYLNALRDDWKSEADPLDECDHYVDISKYDNFKIVGRYISQYPYIHLNQEFEMNQHL